MTLLKFQFDGSNSEFSPSEIDPSVIRTIVSYMDRESSRWGFFNKNNPHSGGYLTDFYIYSDSILDFLREDSSSWKNLDCIKIQENLKKIYLRSINLDSLLIQEESNDIPLN